MILRFTREHAMWGILPMKQNWKKDVDWAKSRFAGL